MKLGNVIRKPVHTAPKTSAELILSDAKVGVEVEVENWHGLNPLSLWDNHVDDSLRGQGQEFTTAGGLSGAALVQAIDELCILAKEQSWSEGYPRAAIHIHLDVTDMEMDKGELATFMSLYLIVEHALFAYAGEWRRSCGFCDSFEESSYAFDVLGGALYDKSGEALRSLLRDNRMNKYQAVNLLSLSSFGTLEFRQLPTTFDRNRIVTWINFILQLKLAASKYEGDITLLQSFSKQGASAFTKDIMGEMWPKLAPYFNESRAWSAVDNAMALMCYGGGITPEKEAVDVWSDDYNTPAPLVATKLALLSKREGQASSVPSGVVSVMDTGNAVPDRSATLNGLQAGRLHVQRNPFQQYEEVPVVENENEDEPDYDDEDYN